MLSMTRFVQCVVLAWAVLVLAACATDMSYNYAPSGQWTRTDCVQSDKEYRLADRQWHCVTRGVTAAEAEAQRR